MFFVPVLSMMSNQIQRRNIVLTSLLVVVLSWTGHKQLTSTSHLHISNDLLHAISGSIASAISITLFYPLETIRTRLQVDSTRYKSGRTLQILYKIVRNKNEGILSLYRGWSSLVLALVTLNFVYFYCFRAFKRTMEQAIRYYWLTPDKDNVFKDINTNKIVIDLMTGYLAGVVGVLLTGPLWLVNTRLKLQGIYGKSTSNIESNTITKTYHGIAHCIYTISREEGIASLWNGTMTSILLALNPAIQLGVYELLKRHHSVITFVSGVLSLSISLVRQNDEIKDEESGSNMVMEPFLNALLAKFMATVVTYPIQVIQTQHRADISPSMLRRRSKCSGWIHDLQTITRQHGISGLYRGFEAKLLQASLHSGLMFLIYENLFEFLKSILN